MSSFLNLILGITSTIMDSIVTFQNSNATNMEISFQLDPALESGLLDDLSIDVDLTDFVEMESVDLDDFTDMDIIIDSDTLIDNVPFSRMLGLYLQSLIDIDDFYLQYELPASIVEFLEAINNPPLENHPVPEDVLNSFPIVKLDLSQLSKKEDCPICLETFKSKDNVLFLACNHYYHEECIKRWFQEQNFCPVCKQEV